MSRLSLTRKVRPGALVGIRSDRSASCTNSALSGVFIKWVLPEWCRHAGGQSSVLQEDWDSADVTQDCAESLQAEIEAMQEQDLDLMALVLVGGTRAQFLQEQLIYPWPAGDERNG